MAINRTKISPGYPAMLTQRPNHINHASGCQVPSAPSLNPSLATHASPVIGQCQRRDNVRRQPALFRAWAACYSLNARPRSSEDRALASGARCVGSNPSGGTYLELVSKVVGTLRLMPHSSEFVPTRPTPDCVRWLSTPPKVTFETTSNYLKTQRVAFPPTHDGFSYSGHIPRPLVSPSHQPV